jgi:hypothetical protein
VVPKKKFRQRSSDGRENKASVLRPAIGNRQKELMMMVLLRIPEAFKTAVTKLKPAHFDLDIDDQYLQVIWSCLTRLYDKRQKLPSHELLAAEIELEASILGSDLSNDQLQRADELLNAAFATKRSALRRDEDAALDFLQRFLEENLQKEIQDTVSQGQDVVTDVYALLQEKSEEAHAIRTIKTGAIEDLFPEDLEEIKAVEKETTGCPFFDRFMVGQAVGEVYGFGAPYGVCKTTIAVQLAVERARFMANKHRTAKNPPVVYIVVWEEEKVSIQHRILSYAAQVEKTHIENAEWDKLSSAKKGDYKPYELDLWGSMIEAGKKVPGELDRVRMAKAELNRNLRMIDFTGSRPEYSEYAASLSDGVVAVIEADQRQRRNPGVGMVVMDYAGAAADRYLSATGLAPDKHLRHLIGKLPLRAKNQIAVPFQCPVWIMQQLSTKVNARRFGGEIGITDFGEAGNFGENCAFVFVVGQKSHDDLCQMYNVKQRRAAAQSGIVVRVDGLYAQVKDVSHEYVIESGRIVSRMDRDRVARIIDADDDSTEVDILPTNIGL